MFSFPRSSSRGDILKMFLFLFKLKLPEYFSKLDQLIVPEAFLWRDLKVPARKSNSSLANFIRPSCPILAAECCDFFLFLNKNRHGEKISSPVTMNTDDIPICAVR